MKKIFSSFLIAGFILWILPLGVFIKPSLQKLACDGQRAMCMCHVFAVKTFDKAMEPGLTLTAGASASKENSSGGGSNSFISAKPIAALNLQTVSVFENQYLSYKTPFLASLEHVPKI